MEHEGQLISVDSRVSNNIINEAIVEEIITELVNYRVDHKEFCYGDSRFDLKLTNDST